MGEEKLTSAWKIVGRAQVKGFSHFHNGDYKNNGGYVAVFVLFPMDHLLL